MRVIRPRKSTRTYITYLGRQKRTIKESFIKGGSEKKAKEDHIPPVLLAQTSTSENNDIGISNCVQETIYSKKKKERIEEWSSLRDALFDVYVQSHEPPTACTLCLCSESDIQLYRCLDCCPWEVLCLSCLETRHQYPHLHMFETWMGGTYIGYCKETPVWRTKHCCSTTYCKEIVVVDEKGRQHIRTIQFCKCEAEPVTLLRLGLWPSSPKYPRLAFHLDLLWWIYGLLLETQTSVKGFCESLKARLPKHHKAYVSSEVQDVYKVLMTETMEEFKHFVYRTDRLSHVNVVLDDGTQCAACYQMPLKIFSFDADFQLVRKASGGNSWDTGKFSNKFFLVQEEVDAFVNVYRGDAKKSDVDFNDFQAASAVRSKNKSKKLAETAVFGSTCRHGFPKYFFSLKHGERLGYSVFLLQKILEETPHGEMVHIMYDIACVLHSHLKKQNRQEILDRVKFTIPIFHCYGHKIACQVLYSPRRAPGVGLIDGESVERLWSYLGKFSRITKEMTPENRIDLLTMALVHYGQKIQDRCAKSLAGKHQKALEMENSSRQELHETLSTLEGVTMEDVSRWTEEEVTEVVLMGKNEKEEKLTLKEEYSFALESLHESGLNKNAKTSTRGLDKPTQRNLETIKRCEKKLALNWEVANEDYKESLKTGKDKRRKKILFQIQKQVSNRVFLLELVKKYARGQAVAIRLIRQLKKTTTSMEKLILEYNTIDGPSVLLPESITFENVKNPESLLWQLLPETTSTGVPFSMKHKLINLNAVVERSLEEQDLVKQ